jgi:hypothetical protein
LAVPEKIFNLESRPSVRSAASLASCAGARGVHTAGGALLGSATPILFFVFPSSSTTTLTCSLPITHLGVRARRDAAGEERRREETNGEEESAAALAAMGGGGGGGIRVFAGG